MAWPKREAWWGKTSFLLPTFSQVMGSTLGTSNKFLTLKFVPKVDAFHWDKKFQCLKIKKSPLWWCGQWQRRECMCSGCRRWRDGDTFRGLPASADCRRRSLGTWRWTSRRPWSRPSLRVMNWKTEVKIRQKVHLCSNINSCFILQKPKTLVVGMIGISTIPLEH